MSLGLPSSCAWRGKISMVADKGHCDSTELIEPIQWCRFIVNTGYAMSGLIVLAHIIWFFAASSILAWPVDVYIRDYILLPTALLFTLCFLVSRAIRINRLSLQLKEILSLSLYIFFSFYLTMTHDIAIVLMSSYILPIFASTLFSSVKITRGTMALSTAALLATAAKRYLTGKMDGDMAMQVFAAFFLFICAYLLARLLIRNGQNHFAALAHSDDAQKYMQEQLLLDPFTGLFNRKTFDSDLGQMWLEGRSSGKALAVAMIDIDEFKIVNDRFGHAAGDRVLMSFSRVLKKIQADNIRVYRIGGDEFTILFRDCEISEAFQVCEEIRKQMKGASLRDSDNHKVTVSCGLASMVPDDRAASALTTAADTALYAAKSQGRNRVVKYGEQEKIRT